MHIAFPTDYAPELGNVVCTVNLVSVPCSATSPWWLTITGPSTPTGQAQEFTLLVKGVRQIDGSSAGKIYLGLASGYNTDVSANHVSINDVIPVVPHTYWKQVYITDFTVSTQ